MEHKKSKVSRSENPAPSKSEEKKEPVAEKPRVEDVVTVSPEPVKPKKTEEKPGSDPKPEVKKESDPKPEIIKEVKKEPEVPCTFSRWFRSKGFKPHWQAGMEAYADVSRKRTPSEWDLIFKNY